MIDFQPEDRTQQRLVGGIATLIYAVSVLLLLLLLKFQLLPPPDNGEGLMINFGNVEEAAPGADLAMNDQAAEAPQQPQQQAPPQQAAEDEQLTQDFEETDVVVREKKKDEKKTPKKEDKKVEAKPKPEQKPVEKPREVNRKALFPGRTEGSKAASEGTGTGAGNQGNPAGTPEGSHEGTGTGTGGNSASLSGRSLVGMLPKPDYSAKEWWISRGKSLRRPIVRKVPRRRTVRWSIPRCRRPAARSSTWTRTLRFRSREPLPTISGCSDVVLRRTEYSRNSV